MGYTKKEKFGRLLWRLVWATLWKICWNRIYFMRPLLLRVFGARIGLINNLYGSTWIEIPWNLEMPSACSIGPRVHVYNLGTVTIGERVIVSQDSYLCAGTHDYKTVGMPLIRSDISIGNDVWICAGAFIGPGVHIGDGVIVGARAVVMKDVEPWTIVAGNPAKVVGTRKNREPVALPYT